MFSSNFEKSCSMRYYLFSSRFFALFIRSMLEQIFFFLICFKVLTYHWIRGRGFPFALHRKLTVPPCGLI